MSAEAPRKFTDDSVQMVLIGASGSGKSASGNTILGKKRFRSEVSGKSVTRRCQTETEIINDQQITVVDTPGWDCTELPQHEIKFQITETLGNLQGPYSFLLVIHVGRVESMKISVIYDLRELLGPSFFNHTTILFTHSDDLEDKTFKEFLNEGDKEFQELLNKCSRRCHCWNNRDPRSDEDVKKLLQDLKHTEMHESRSAKSPRNEMRHNDCNPSATLLNCERGMKSEEPKTTETQINETEIRVLFLGMTGVGKTSSIETLFGKRLDRKTPQTPVYNLTRSGLNLKLVESPGFDENEEEIEEAISKSLSDCDPGPHVIIIVLSVGRFTPATKKTMMLVQEKLGHNARKHILILFTGEDDLEGKNIHTFIKENQDLRDVMRNYENRFHAFNNKETSNQDQVDEMLHKIDEMYQNNVGNFYTNTAGETKNREIFLHHFYCSAEMSAKAQRKFTYDSGQMVLIGASGSGKSASGNTILGKKCFRSEVSAKSLTRRCQTKTETINGRQITVVDTPGWDCTELPQHEITSQIKETLRNLQGPYSFLLVIHVGRVESIKISVIYDLQKLLGPSFFNHTTILFTHSDDLEFKTFEEFLNERDKEFQELLNKCSGRCHCWNNRDPRSDEDVEKLLQNLKHTEMHESRSAKSPRNEMQHNDRNPSATLLNYERGIKSQKTKTTETQINKTEIRVLFLGMTGVGKTSSIETLLGKRLDRKTPQTPVYNHTRSGLNLKLVESPGFGENEEEIEEAISKSLSDCDPGPHVIIIVLSVGRFTPATRKTMMLVQEKLGHNTRKHILILFTGADNLEGKTIQTFIKENQDLRDVMKHYKNGFHVFNNRDTSNQTQVDKLLHKINKMYRKNKGVFYTNTAADKRMEKEDDRKAGNGKEKNI